MTTLNELLLLSAGTVTKLTFENAGAATLGGGMTTFGQAFVAGDLPAGATLTALVGGVAVPVQLDVKTTYPDGSVKMAVLSLERPDLAAGEALDVVLVRGGKAPAAPPLDLAAALTGHDFTVSLTYPGGTTREVDVLDALRDALADGTASAWQSGPLAAQARVEVPLGGSQRLVFDVTAYAGGGFSVEALFNNDGAMGATGGRVNYTLVATLDGEEVARESVSQGQYQNWHRGFSSNDRDGGQGTGDPASGWLNIHHDAAYLADTGAVARYDLTLGVDEAVLSRWEAQADTTAGWGKPLAPNGLLQYFPMTGGREDLGMLTAPNVAWLITGDARAADRAMDQAEAAGAVPWNFWDAAHGTWLNTDNYPKLWTDPRGGTGRPGDGTSTGLTQQVPWDPGWSPDRAHQPEVSFLPYLLTGERWILDNLGAQAAFNVMTTWPAVRGNANDNLVHEVQVRSGAWGLREIENAAWAAPDGSAEKAYFTSVADANWSWLVSQIPAWTAAQGEAHGWVPGLAGGNGSLSPWQQDYFASTTIAAAARGNADALTFLQWQSNFLIGRFFAEDEGFEMRDGAAYVIAVRDTETSPIYKTWEQIGAETAKRGWSNGDDTWNATQGEYARLAMATLAAIHHLTGSESALGAYKALAAEAPYGTTPDVYTRSPQYAVTIPGIYGGTVIGTAGDDATKLSAATQSLVVDLGAGHDELDLANGGNKGTVSGVEVLKGGSGNDVITLAGAALDVRVDLKAGADALTLSSSGANRIVVADVETILGGSAADDVTFDGRADGVSVDLGAGEDRLVLAGGAPNRVTVRSTETILGGSAADDVTFGATVLDASVNLGGGSDRLVLASSGANRVMVANVETVVGGTAADEVTIVGESVNAAVDLAANADRLVIAATGANTLAVSNAETILGGAGNDDIRLATYASGTVVDLGAGSDRLALSVTSTNRLTVSNVESLVGGQGGDDVTFGAAIGGAFVDLGAGLDRLTLAAGSNLLTTVGVETVVGSDDADDVTFGGIASGGSVTLGAGDDRLTMSGAVSGLVVNMGDGYDLLTLSNLSPNRLTVTSAEWIRGFGANDVVTLMTGGTNLVVNLGGGTDTLTLSNAGGTSTVLGVETLIGGTSGDHVTFGPALTPASVNLGSGADVLTLSSAGPNFVTVSNVETLLGGSSDDTVTLGITTSGMVLDLGGGFDRLTLSSAGSNRVTVANAERIVGGTGADAVTLSRASLDGAFDLGGNFDSLILASDGPNRITATGIETIKGGSAADDVTIGRAATGHTVDLGAGVDRLVLSSSGPNRFAVSNVETLVGGAGADDVTLGAVTGAVVDLGGGADRLLLASGAANRLTVSNVETLLGGNAGDDVTLGTAANGILVDLSSSADRLVLSSAGPNRLTVANVETLLGGSASDAVTYTTTLVGAVDLGGGADRLVLANGNNVLTVSGAEEVIGGVGNDRITAAGTTGARLEGGIGSDTLAGGLGADLLVGGSGADRFVFGPGASPATAPDRIADFDGVSDLLVFQGMLRGTFAFRGASDFTATGRTEARFVDATDQLQVDANGDGTADVLVTLTGVSLSSLSASDFAWS